MAGISRGEPPEVPWLNRQRRDRRLQPQRAGQRPEHADELRVEQEPGHEHREERDRFFERE